jgi:epoxide hydrolase
VAELTEAERARLEHLQYLKTEQSGYPMIQITRPRTLAHGLRDSPVGQLAWIVEKFKEWTDPAAELPEDAVDRDLLITNVMLYWLTGTAGSSANSYYETAHAGAWGVSERSTVPTGIAVSPWMSIRRTVELEHTVVHWSEFGRGGHFAAMEAPPDLLVDDVRAFFSKLR